MAATLTTPPQGLPDIIAPDLRVLFCGINPGLLAAATGHHFAGRANRFWRVLHLAGFTPDEMSPEDDHALLAHGYGLTAVVARPTASADELSAADFTDVAHAFREKIAACHPCSVAFLGKAAYAALTRQRDVTWGAQPVLMDGATAWVLPNPSGRNRAFSIEQLVAAYRVLYRATVDATANARG